MDATKCFISNYQYDVYADLHDEILEWLKSDEVSSCCFRLIASDSDRNKMKEALNWRDKVIKPNKHHNS